MWYIALLVLAAVAVAACNHWGMGGESVKLTDEVPKRARASGVDVFSAASSHSLVRFQAVALVSDS